MSYLHALRSALGQDAGLLHRFLVRALAYGIVQGAALACLVPVADALTTGDPQRAWRWTAVLAALTAGSLVLHYAQAMSAFAVALSVLRRLQHRIGDHVVSLPLGWFRADRAAEVALAATKGTLSVGNTAAHSLGHVVTGWASAATLAVLAVFWDPRMGTVLLVATPVILLVRQWTLRIADGADERTATRSAEVNRHLLEYARCQPVLRAAGRSRDYRPLERAISQHSLAQRRLLWTQVSALALSGAVLQAALAGLLLVGMWGLLGGTATAGVVVGLLAAGLRYYQGVALAAEHMMALRTAQLDLQRVRHILDSPPLPTPAVSAPPVTPGSVVLEGVTFGYDANPVLSDVSLRAEPGSQVAIVGPSGAGKSTIMSLIARFHDVDAGTVRVGGRDVREQTTADLMSQLSLVFQDVYLFDESLEANIRLGNPEATTAEVRDAAHAAGVTEIVRRLPNGWDARVGEGGTALSGGEKQRISLARALLKKAPILLLDEATAALDPQNERHFTSSLHVLRRRTTVLVIAHRLHTIIEADTIVMLSAEGRVLDQGTHDELLHRCEQYQRFWRSRETAEHWQLPTA